MADWTDNPFAAAQSAPSGRKPANDPFSDPSVVQATATIPEYNPFENPGSVKPPAAKPTAASPTRSRPAPAPVSAPPQEPAVMKAETSAPPSWAVKAPSPTQAPAEPISNLRAPADVEREQQYNARQAAADIDPNDVDRIARTANFPPIPAKLQWGIFKPCFRLDIKGEIPVYGQAVTKLVYYTWLLYAFTLFWNFVCEMAALACSKCDDQSVSCALASAYLLFYTPCSYACWFHPLYNGVRRDSSMRFGIFFLIMICQFAFSCVMAVGIEGSGGSGIIVSAKAVKSDKIAGILMFTGAILWIMNALVQFFAVGKVLKFYRSTGGSFEKAQQEAVYAAASNKTIQKAAVQGATAAFTSQYGSDA